jgi:ferredoxin-NADP reductase
MEMTLSYPVNLFALDNRAKKHLMIAGGIGITPFLAQIRQLSHLGGKFELHYSARSKPLGRLYGPADCGASGPGSLLLRRSEADDRPEEVLQNQPIGTHLYVCGPKGMIGWVLSTAESMGWPKQALHSEEFIAPGTGLPFTVELAASGKTITVGPTQSLLEAMEAAGVDAPYLCRGGACGQCETTVHKCDGTILHRDHWLTPEEHASNQKIMPCVSRFEGKTLVIDR